MLKNAFRHDLLYFASLIIFMDDFVVVIVVISGVVIF